MKYFLLLAFYGLIFSANSQIVDNFSDGDFTTNPTWGGTTADFIVNPTFELQSNGAVAATSYLSLTHGLSDLNDKEWQLTVKITTAPSSGNFGRFYLTSTASDITTNPDGYYLQFGEAGSTDAVRLFKSVGGVPTQLCASADGTIAASFTVGVRVIRSATGDWSLYCDFAGGTSYTLQQTTNDASALLGTHAGWMCTYTASNTTKYYLDNVYIGNEIIDTNPPVLVSATAINANLIDVLFDEAVTTLSAENSTNYDIQPFLSASSATVDGSNPALVHIVPISALQNGNTYTLFATNISDLNSNVAGQQLTNFTYFVPEIPAPGDLIINEFMCDPTPVVGLPEVEFVEIYNRSSKFFDLSGWRLGDASADGTITSGIIAPGEYKVLASTSSIVDYPNAFPVTSFPSLNNSGDSIVLKYSDLTVIDVVYYNSSWYQDAVKDDGGYTLERKNPLSICSDASNWSASNASSGGTPEAQNSVYNLDPDVTAPAITSVVVTGASSIIVYCSEALDSASIEGAIISTNPSLTLSNILPTGEHQVSFTLVFNETFQVGQLYQLTLNGIQDCSGNSTQLFGQFAVADVPSFGDVVINELLFDPYTGGSDWVELHNVSDKLLDLSGWQIANWDDTVSNVKTLVSSQLLFPGDYVVVGKDSSFVLENYPAAISGKFYQNDLPSMNNDSGTVYLFYPDFFGPKLMDKVSYQDDWHFKLLDSKDGKSLERIAAEAPSDEASSWHTAAEAIGFGTPGGPNSQFYPVNEIGDLGFVSEVISPDNDGFEDILQITYSLDQPGYLGTMRVYDQYGRLVADLIQNELLASEGVVVWDGVNNEGTKASIGPHILVFEAFNIDGGSLFAKRKAFVVAGKM